MNWMLKWNKLIRQTFYAELWSKTFGKGLDLNVSELKSLANPASNCLLEDENLDNDSASLFIDYSKNTVHSNMAAFGPSNGIAEIPLSSSEQDDPRLCDEKSMFPEHDKPLLKCKDWNDWKWLICNGYWSLPDHPQLRHRFNVLCSVYK